MGYRDDREALLQQLDELRREVEDLRAASGDDKVIAERINRLTTEVSSALLRTEENREVLQKLASSLGSLKPTVGAPDAKAARRSANRGLTASPTPGWGKASAVAAGSAILVVGMSLAIGVGLVRFSTRPSSQPPALQPNPHRELPNATKVDPLAMLASAQSGVTSGSLLESIDARYVSDDGTIDLWNMAYEASVTYNYLTPPPPPRALDLSIPLGAPHPARVEAPRVSDSFTLNRSGFIDYNSKKIGAEMNDTSVPPPACSTRAVWEAAKKAGAPSGAVAHLVYRQGVLEKNAVWQFRIPNTSHAYEISDPGCTISNE